MDSKQIKDLINASSIAEELKQIGYKVLNEERITTDECLTLYKDAELPFLGMLANFIRFKKNGDYVYFNKNIHIEPTNVCIHNCTFCSYARKKGEEGEWIYSIEDMVQQVVNQPKDGITEVHIVGGVHPDRGLEFYEELLVEIKKVAPELHIKAFTAIEIEYMAVKSKLSFEETLTRLQKAGLGSMPGGGAEIFDEEIRAKVCSSKTLSKDWIALHSIAHSIGMPTNATILYGHIETYEHRIDHMNRLREAQDKDGKFQAFIPLKYKKANNPLGLKKEVSWNEDLRNFAVARIFLDNFQHIKSYWPMLGKELSQISLEYGVNDFDGTINDSTKIYSMAGAEDQSPSMTTEQMVKMIKQAKRIPTERNSTYKKLATY